MSPARFAFIFWCSVTVILATLYNSLIYKKNQVDNAFSSIDVILQKRWDLIPNLVAVAQNYMQFEQQTLTQIAKLRTKAISDKVNANTRVELENQISSLLSKLLNISVILKLFKPLKNFATETTQRLKIMLKPKCGW